MASHVTRSIVRTVTPRPYALVPIQPGRELPNCFFTVPRICPSDLTFTMSVRTVSQVGRSLPAYANTAGRAVHIKIHPQPRNLSESTEVLRVLQQYGEVVMYKHLKVIVIFSSSIQVHVLKSDQEIC